MWRPRPGGSGRNTGPWAAASPTDRSGSGGCWSARRGASTSSGTPISLSRDRGDLELPLLAAGSVVHPEEEREAQHRAPQRRDPVVLLQARVVEGVKDHAD